MLFISLLSFVLFLFIQPSIEVLRMFQHIRCTHLYFRNRLPDWAILIDFLSSFRGGTLHLVFAPTAVSGIAVVLVLSDVPAVFFVLVHIAYVHYNGFSQSGCQSMPGRWWKPCTPGYCPPKKDSNRCACRWG